MILSLTGPSGVGKTTLMHNLLHALPHATPLISYTTRAPRPTDEPGEYAYITNDEFDAMKARGEFLWEAHAYVNRYGTRVADIDAALEGGLSLPILVIDVVETLYEYAKSKGKENAVKFMYIRIDDEAELRKRFAERGDKLEEAEARIVECRSWNERAQKSAVPFLFLHATKTREEILNQALTALETQE